MKKKAIASQQSLFDDHPELTSAPALDQEEHDFVFDILDYLQSPIIVYDPSWADMLPPRYIDLVPIQRLAAGIRREPLATEAEVILYIYTWSMVRPIHDHHWVNIYTYLVGKTIPKGSEENLRET
ncbi:MAG TPA: hypothetical protein VKQ52_20070, partial [Puia sp.]|nr:hypothetical protein [Puia sp.]